MHVLVNCTGDADTAWFRQRLKPKRYVYSIPMHIVVIGNDITEINTDA
jgi:hypothetical protein